MSPTTRPVFTRIRAESDPVGAPFNKAGAAASSAENSRRDRVFAFIGENDPFQSRELEALAIL
jgi:hypothetical protein